MSLRDSFTQTATPQRVESPEITKRARSPPKSSSRGSQDLGKDWAKSRLYKMAKAIVDLPKNERFQKQKAIEEQHFNPTKADIYTEQEAAYNASLVQKQYHQLNEPDREENDTATDDNAGNMNVNIDEMHKKGMRTLMLLTNVLLDKDESESGAVLEEPELILAIKNRVNLGESFSNYELQKPT